MVELNNLRILFVGNSYTNFNSLIICFKNMVEKQGINVDVEKVAYGNQYLHDYVKWEEGDYFHKLEEMVNSKKFDIAFMQGQSREAIEFPGDFYESARRLYKYLSEHGMKCLMYQSWGYPVGYAELMAEIGCKDTEDMARKLAAGYEAIANELEIEVSPAGSAFLEVFKKYQDNTSLLYYADDNSHPSPIGTYLVALCHYAKIYGKSPIGVNYKFSDYANDNSITWHAAKVDSISDELQRDLELAAYNAVFGPSIVTEEYKISSVGITK